MKIHRGHGGPMAVLVGLALVAGAGTVGAQQRSDINGHKLLDEAQWGAGKLAKGTKLFVEGRWHECHGSNIKLILSSANEQAARGFFVAGSPEIQARLAANRTPRLNEPLVERGSTVRMFGTVDVREGKAVLVVQDVEKLEDDLVRYQREFAALAAGDVDGLGRLAGAVSALADRYRDPAMRALADEIAGKELAERLKILGTDNHAGALELAAKMKARGDRRGAIALLGGVERASGATAAQKDEARARLGELEAILDGATWVPFEKFKQDEGFIRRPATTAGRWMRREQAELEDERLKYMALANNGVVILRQNPIQAGALAQQKKLEVGQYMEEAREAGGQPVSVRHLQAPDSEGKVVDWAQWIFADGRRAYFIQTDAEKPSDLFAWKPATEAWPTE